MEEMNISIRNLDKSYGDYIIYKNFNIDFHKNKVNCILGKSGCGKSTLLNIISGVLKCDNGHNHNIKNASVSYIFQEDRLIEWMTVEENLKLISKKCYEEKELENICRKYLELVGVYEYKDYYPQMLSGGIRQRVNVARAFIYPSQVVLMDEPFKSIDIKNKTHIMDSLKQILKNDKRTVVFVTHDIEEALHLSDEIYILSEKPVKVKLNITNNDITKEELKEFI